MIFELGVGGDEELEALKANVDRLVNTGTAAQKAAIVSLQPALEEEMAARSKLRAEARKSAPKKTGGRKRKAHETEKAPSAD